MIVMMVMIVVLTVMVLLMVSVVDGDAAGNDADSGRGEWWPSL